jgi:hypothetical protein
MERVSMEQCAWSSVHGAVGMEQCTWSRAKSYRAVYGAWNSVVLMNSLYGTKIVHVTVCMEQCHIKEPEVIHGAECMGG